VTIFREKAIAENRAKEALDGLFAEYKKQTGISLFASSHYDGKKVHVTAYEGEQGQPRCRPTDKFKNNFSSNVEMLEYFNDAINL